MSKIKRFFIGKPLSNESASGEKLSVIWGVSILSSDALSSVAYALQEIMGVLVPAIGALAFGYIQGLTFVILSLIFMVIFSYYKIIGVYSNGGGGYSVVSDNFPRFFALLGGGALLHSYVLTVSVSVVSGVQQLTSMFPNLLPFSTIIVILFILLITWGNLRGISESAKLFGVLPYLFIFFLGVTIIYGLFQVYTGHLHVSTETMHHVAKGSSKTIGLFLLLRAFSSGCSSLTGIEAISNTVPHFKKPEVKNARIVLLILGGILGFLFVGVTLLTFKLHVIPTEGESLIVLLGEHVFGKTFFYYGLSFSTLIILIMAANTSYSGFPSLSAVMAKDGYLPRQLTQLGDRLAFNNGIIILSILSIFFVLIFKDSENQLTTLIAIYAIGVFITFTLSQFAFVKHLWTNKEKYKNGKLMSIPSIIGGTSTALVTVILSLTKFFAGAWIALVLIAILMVFMLKISNHYNNVKENIHIYPNDEANEILKKERSEYNNDVIVTVSSLNTLSVNAIKYSQKIALLNTNSIYQRITVLSVATDENMYKSINDKFNEVFKNTNINHEVIYSEYREVAKPISKYVKERVEILNQDGGKGNVTVVFPQIVEKVWWHKLLHAQMINKLSKELRKTDDVVLSIMPEALK